MCNFHGMQFIGPYKSNCEAHISSFIYCEMCILNDLNRLVRMDDSIITGQIPFELKFPFSIKLDFNERKNHFSNKKIFSIYHFISTYFMSSNKYGVSVLFNSQIISVAFTSYSRPSDECKFDVHKANNNNKNSQKQRDRINIAARNFENMKSELKIHHATEIYIYMNCDADFQCLNAQIIFERNKKLINHEHNVYIVVDILNNGKQSFKPAHQCRHLSIGQQKKTHTNKLPEHVMYIDEKVITLTIAAYRKGHRSK